MATSGALSSANRWAQGWRTTVVTLSGLQLTISALARLATRSGARSSATLLSTSNARPRVSLGQCTL